MKSPVQRFIVLQSLLLLGAIFAVTAEAAAAGADRTPEQTPEEVIVTGHRYSDPCLAIAAAKVAQWNQTRLRRVETRTFADGSTHWVETIATANTFYRRTDTTPWTTGQVTVGQRRAGSPERVEKNMGLSNCRLGEDGAANANPAGSYLFLFDYAPDKDGSRPSGEMLISNASGLPLRQDMQEPSQGADAKRPVHFSVVYSYGDDVKVPLGAEVAEHARRNRHAECLRELQEPSSPPVWC